jgi:hypothetical protein
MVKVKEKVYGEFKESKTLAKVKVKEVPRVSMRISPSLFTLSGGRNQKCK